MSASQDDSMPPRPECEFEFNLPHGIDTEESASIDSDHNDKSMQNSQDDQAVNSTQRSHDSLDDLFKDPESHDRHSVEDQHQAQQSLNYDTFQPGFSDDEGGGEVFKSSWTAQQARKASPKNKKSPRRLQDDDGDEEISPMIKRPRKSLFGGPDTTSEDQAAFENIANQNEDLQTPEPSKPDIRHRLSSLNLVQQEAQDTRTYDLSFRLGSSDEDSMSPIPSRALSEESVIIPSDDQPAYELRQNIDRTKAFTYIDTDKTGNYDPSHEARLKALRLQKAKAAKSATKKRKKGKGKEKVHKEHIMKFIVKIRFRAFGNVRNLTNDEDNWPEKWSEVDSDCEKEIKECRDFYRHNTPDCNTQIAIKDHDGGLDDLTGYPVARGCRQCRRDEQDCSMIEGGTFPCEQCEDEEIECEPVIKPTTKGRCKQCVDDEQERCSFEDDSAQAICDRCMDNHYACEALPPRGYKFPRISIDEIMYGPDRKHIQCTFCRSEKKRCSLKKKTHKPPCKYCKKHSIGCTFYDLPNIAAKGKVAMKKKVALGPTDGDAPEVTKPGSDFFSLEDLADMERNEEDAFSREITPEIEMEDDAGHNGLLTKIKTSFAHPIQFNVKVKAYQDCNFCDLSFFGFIGHLEREVHVIRWYNGLGYTEVGGGHCENHGTTKMCIQCTDARLQIIVCPNHELRSSANQDFGIAGAELTNAEPGSEDMKYQLQRWCSMCFSVAAWGCAKFQPSLLGDEEAEVEGCGLRLCDKCASTLRDEYDWNLEDMADEMARWPKTSDRDEQTGELEQKPRADVGFLRDGGLLMRCVTAAADGD